ncbi:MAG: hypothetical protein MZV70_10520 [Desulfobacterales bacterium]|nr:hypothetical protein [Desulfobacterales bacterium]
MSCIDAQALALLNRQFAVGLHALLGLLDPSLFRPRGDRSPSVWGSRHRHPDRFACPGFPCAA